LSRQTPIEQSSDNENLTVLMPVLVLVLGVALPCIIIAALLFWLRKRDRVEPHGEYDGPQHWVGSAVSRFFFFLCHTFF
jgi:hypothetical protein